MAIVHMKKLRLMVVRRQKDELLRDLMLLGCVQISEPDALLADAESAAVLRQESGNVTEVRSELTRLTAALKLLDKEVDFYRFPGENHEMSRSGSPIHRVQRAEIILDWFAQKLA